MDPNDSKEGIRAHARGRSYIPDRYEATEYTDPNALLGQLFMSKKARKLASRLTVAELKQLVRRPDVVEVEDVTASDPRLLVYLKSYRNTVPVPRHWCSKRHYLQGRRGTEKPPFKLPGRRAGVA